MSAVALSWAVMVRGTSTYGKVILLNLAHAHSVSNGGCRITQAALLDRTELPLPLLMQGLAELQTDDHIAVGARRTYHRRTPRIALAFEPDFEAFRTHGRAATA